MRNLEENRLCWRANQIHDHSRDEAPLADQVVRRFKLQIYAQKRLPGGLKGRGQLDEPPRRKHRGG